MKLLDAVNLVLPKLGERAVTSLEVKHPTLAVVLPIIEQRLRSTLNRGWWFNEYPYTVPLSPDGEAYLGTDTLSFVPVVAGEAVQRGDRLFNPTTLSYVFTKPIQGVITQYVQFDELPDTAATHVFYAALVEAYATDLGVTTELQLWQSLAATGWSDLLSEHLKNRKHSTKNSPRWKKLIKAMSS